MAWLTSRTPEVMHTGKGKKLYPAFAAAHLQETWSSLARVQVKGPGGLLRGPRFPAGDTRAWDGAETGKFNLDVSFRAPAGPRTGHDTWADDSWKGSLGRKCVGLYDRRRGAWHPSTCPSAPPNNDRVGVDRPGNNLFANSLVAVKGRYRANCSGTTKWSTMIFGDLDLENATDTVRRKT